MSGEIGSKMTLLFPKSSLLLLVAILLSINWMYLDPRTTQQQSTGSRSKYHKLIYDDSYITEKLEDKNPYLKNDVDGKYIGPRDYFDFKNIFEPSEEYFNGVNVEQHYYKEYQAMEITSAIASLDQWQYSSDELLRRSAGPQANEVKCKQELEFIWRQVKLITRNASLILQPGIWNIQFVRYLDSWARPPSETYYGRPYWVGSYRGCLAAKLPAQESKWNEPMEFRFCWAKLKMQSWPTRDEMLPPISIRSGICIPKSCDTSMARRESRAIQSIMQFNFSPFHKQRFNEIIDIYCLPHTKPDIWGNLTTSGRVFVYIMSSWLAVILVCSLARFALDAESVAKLPRGKLTNLLDCLTIQRNLHSFLNDDEPEAGSRFQQVTKETPIGVKKRVDFRPMGVMRFFGSVLICVGHVGLGVMWTFQASTWSIEFNRRLSVALSSGSYKILDLFFVLGGITAANSIMSKLPNEKIKSIIRPPTYLAINLTRYLRLAPLVILVLSFMKAIYPHLSHGPMWDYATYKYSIQGRCQASSWWRVLLWPILFGYGGNSYSSECLLVSWYLITDMKIFLLVPFILYLMCHSKDSISTTTHRATWLSLALVLLSTASHFKDLYLQEIVYYKQFFTYGIIFAINTLMSNFGETGYFNSINRLSSVVIGLYAGFWLRRYDEQKLHQWPTWMRGRWFCGMMLWQLYDILSPAINHLLYQQTGSLPSESSIIWALTLKPRIDAIIVAILALRLSTDLAPGTMALMMPFYKLSKLSYCVFCTHSILIAYYLSANETSRPEVTGLLVVCNIIYIVAASFLISFPLYILFESPVALISASLIRGGASRSSKLNTSTSSMSANASTDSGGQQVDKLRKRN